MAKTKYPIPTPDLIASDLLIDICPRGSDEWTGTRAQLEAEGLIQGHKWSDGAASDCQWSHAGFEYWLRQVRPIGLKGRMQSGVDYGGWTLRRRLTAYGHDGLPRQSRKARGDEPFQTFMRAAIGAPNRTK